MPTLGPGLLIGLCLAHNLVAQLAVVPAPASIRARTSESSDAIHQLKGGERVELGMSVSGEEGCWTAVRLNGVQGYLRCEQLRRETPGTAAPSSSDPQKAAVIDTLLELSGARRQIAQLTDERQFQSMFAGTAKDEQAQQLHQVFARAFRPEAFYRPLRARLEQNLTAARTPILLQWLSSPLSRHVVDLEIQAAAPEARGKLERFAQSLQKESPSQKRLNLVQRLDGALRSSEFRVEMAMVLVRNVTQALGAGRGVDSTADRLRTELWRTARDGTLLHFLYTYQSLSDAELEEYVRFWESDNGHWFAPILHDGFLDAIRAVTEDLLNRLQRLG